MDINIEEVFARAVVAEAKLTKYLLDLKSKSGGSKARFFIGVGFSHEQPNVLRVALGRHPLTARLNEIVEDENGPKFVFVCEIETPSGRLVCIKSIWQIKYGMTTPVLLTAYPHKG